MKRPRTKKLRGGKRKLATPEKVDNSQKPAPAPQSMQNATTARPIAEQTLASTSGPARPTAANSEQPERQANNVLKTKAAPHENASNEADTEVERWISLIREGGLDRKVKVTGKTGALLVR
jgi:hypothetical protein